MQKFSIHMENTTEVPEHLYQAVVETYLQYGLRKTTLEDIARTAGVSRSTIYRQLGSKAEIIQLLAVRELTDLLTTIFSNLDPNGRLEDWADYAFTDGLAAIRANKVVQKATQHERETLAELVIKPQQEPNIIELTGSLLEGFIASSTEANRLRVPPAIAARLIVRLLFSLVIIDEAEQISPVELGRALVSGLAPQD